MSDNKLSLQQQYRFEVIEALYKTKGNKKEAAMKLGCSVRTVNRLLQVYETKGKDGFLHGNKGRTPTIAYDAEIRKEVVALYKQKHLGMNFEDFTKVVHEQFGIQVRRRTVSNWLKEEGIVSPCFRKANEQNSAKMTTDALCDVKTIARLKKEELDHMFAEVETMYAKVRACFEEVEALCVDDAIEDAQKRLYALLQEGDSLMRVCKSMQEEWKAR